MEKTAQTQTSLELIDTSLIGEFFRGLPVVGLVMIMGMVISILNGADSLPEELYWLPAVSGFLVIVGTLLKRNFRYSMVIDFKKGLLQSHYFFFGRVLTFTLADVAETESVAVDCNTTLHNEYGKVVRFYTYKVFLLKKSGRRLYVTPGLFLDEANAVVLKIAGGWNITPAPGREKSFAIINKVPGKPHMITYSSSPPLTTAEKIPSHMFWAFSITFLLLASMFVMSYLF